eukprot:3353344-Rhodomonas_salina.1
MVLLCGSAQDLGLDSEHADSDSKQQHNSKVQLHVDEIDASQQGCGASLYVVIDAVTLWRFRQQTFY